MLPAEIARFGRDYVRHAFLHDVKFRADGYLLQRYGHMDLARQVRVVEPVRVADALVGR